MLLAKDSRVLIIQVCPLEWPGKPENSEYTAKLSGEKLRTAYLASPIMKRANFSRKIIPKSRLEQWLANVLGIMVAEHLLKEHLNDGKNLVEELRAAKEPVKENPMV
jgi:hypothetical protein